MKKLFFPLVLVVFIFIFFWQFIIKGLLPIPSDTIVGLYHPYRDFYSKNYPNGIAFKNYILTDPVRQQYIWKNLAITSEKKLQMPLWNPYTFLGQPLLANFQSGALYPLNFVFFILNFNIAWSIFIMLQPLLASIFMYLYLKNLGLKSIPSVLGGLIFALCGFSASWLEWGNVVSTALWLPLILLSIDKLFIKSEKIKINLLWSFIYLFSVISSFLAGHLQIFFYAFIVSFLYFFLKWYTGNKSIKTLGMFLLTNIVILFIISPQLIATLKFIFLSARNLDRNYIVTSGWFLPWQNLIQFIIPDFFGNPSTLNYWGVWNYGEFIGYVGIGGFMLSIFALFRKDKKTFFFFTILIISLIFALPNLIAELPYKFNIPFLSTSQPTRLIFITDFCLSILAALGFDSLLRLKNKRNIIHVLLISAFIFSAIWLSVYFIFKQNIGINFTVVKQNLILPTILFILNSLILLMFVFFKNKKYTILLSVLILIILFADLTRFGLKYLPFTDGKYLYPDTKILSFLKTNNKNFRILSSDARILPSNFSAIYKLQMADGYDPLFLENYAEFISAINRNKPDIKPPFGFNRIISLQNYNSSFINLLGIKYVLSFDNIINNNFIKVLEEGNTKVYENKNVFNRAFFVNNIIFANSNEQAIKLFFDYKDQLSNTAIIQGKEISYNKLSQGTVNIIRYEQNQVILETNNKGNGFLILTDSYYPDWKAEIDGKNENIYKTDYNFRGIFVPKGKHQIVFKINL